MNILITGARGQLGLELERQLGTWHGNALANLVLTDIHNLDIADEIQVHKLIKAERPDVVINCAAYTNVDGCESDEQTAFRINAIGARNLAAAAYAVNAKVLQVSTDYVFDGLSPQPRREYDPVDPMSVYGKSKALGEKLVTGTNPRHFIVRTAWLYGEGNNFVRTMLRLAGEKDELQVVADQIGSPTSTVDLAKSILQLIQTESYGIYHGTCEGHCSWYEFAQKIFELKGLNVKVIPITTEQLNRPAKRPKYSVLENHMFNLLGLNTFRNISYQIIGYLIFIKSVPMPNK